MGKPAEPFDDGAVPHSEVQESCKGRFSALGNYKDQLPEEIDGPMLVHKFLGVFQW